LVAFPLILLAARANEAHAIQGLQHGADDYLIKPFTTQQLLGRIQAGLQRSDRIHWRGAPDVQC
jgi:DNA-binding response OmpR family regulator